MKVLFHESALTDYQSWATDDLKVFRKISGLIKEITRTPFTGTGKPEPLRGNLSGFWVKTAYCFLLFRICAITIREIPTNSKATLTSN